MLSTLRAALPGRGSSMPDDVLERVVSVDPVALARYAHVCGFILRDELPATYPHVLAFPLEQVGHGLDGPQVVDRDHVDVGPLLAEGSVEVAADPAEAVDADSDAHASGASWVVADLSDQILPIRANRQFHQRPGEQDGVVRPPVLAGDRPLDTADLDRRVGEAAGVAEHDVDLDAVLGERTDMVAGVEARRLGLLRAQVGHVDPAGAGGVQRLADLGNQRGGDHARVERSRAEHHLIGGLDGGDRGGGGWWIGWGERDPPDAARVLDLDLALDRPAARFRLQGHRLDGGREDRSGGADQPPHLGDGPDEVARCLGQPDDEEVAQGVTAQLPRLESVLEGGTELGVGIGEGGQAPADVTGRRYLEGLAEASARAPVVGHRHHGGDGPGIQPGRPERGGQAVPTADGHDRWSRHRAPPGAACVAGERRGSFTCRCPGG